MGDNKVAFRRAHAARLSTVSLNRQVPTHLTTWVGALKPTAEFDAPLAKLQNVAH
jgi:hypothetical protein